MSEYESFARALTAVEAALDWARLGACYCDGDADDFFDADRIEAVRDAGLRFAADLGEALAERRASTYVGAGVAELAPILFEHVVLGRDVAIHTKARRECELLCTALARAEQSLDRALPRWTLDPVDTTRRADHLWLVSVLTDPDAFPALHRELYERGRSGRTELLAERVRAAELVDSALAGLAPPALVHTSSEEVPFLVAGAERRNARFLVPEVGRLSPLVGDVVHLCRLESR